MAEDHLYGKFESDSKRDSEVAKILEFEWIDVIRKIESGQLDDQALFAMSTHPLPDYLTVEEKQELQRKFQSLYLKFVKEKIDQSNGLRVEK